jgi:hypothetical protein
MVVPYRIYDVHVELHRTTGLLGFLCRRDRNHTHSFQCHGRDGAPSLLPHRVGQIDVVGMLSRPLFVLSGVLHGSYGEKAKTTGLPQIILGTSSEPSLRSFDLQRVGTRIIFPHRQS